MENLIDLRTSAPNLAAVKGRTTDAYLSAMCTGISPSSDPSDTPKPWQAIGSAYGKKATAIQMYL